MARFQELDWCRTPLGELVLRRRFDPITGQDVDEIKLNDEFLMSSQFTASEVALGRLALDRATGDELDVVVGGLGLGFTAVTVLESSAVRSLTVVDALGEIIDWHRRGLIASGAALVEDRRCELVQGDFFEMVRSADGLCPKEPGRRFHAIAVDIDHSPRHPLHEGNAWFYEVEGLRRLREHLRPGGVFALWSNDPPDEPYVELLRQCFAEVDVEVVRFPNPLQDREATNTVYLAVTAPE